eukprot:s9_g7.t1
MAGEEEAGVPRRPPPGPPVELRRHSVLMVCRSLLGKVRYTDEDRPSADALQRSCLGEAAAYDSVLGDRQKIHGTFREFVLYHDDQVYPEFIVVYERKFFHERFQEIYEQMVQRCRRRSFQGPTREEEEVLRSLWDRYAMPHKGRIDKWQLLDLCPAFAALTRIAGSWIRKRALCSRPTDSSKRMPVLIERTHSKARGSSGRQ